MNNQPNLSTLFELHAFRSTRCVAGFHSVHILNRSGRYKNYTITSASQARLERVKAAFGSQVLPTQWDFPERAECPE